MQKSLTFLYNKIDNFNSMLTNKLGPENNGMEDNWVSTRSARFVIYASVFPLGREGSRIEQLCTY